MCLGGDGDEGVCEEKKECQLRASSMCLWAGGWREWGGTHLSFQWGRMLCRSLSPTLLWAHGLGLSACSSSPPDILFRESLHLVKRSPRSDWPSGAPSPQQLLHLNANRCLCSSLTFSPPLHIPLGSGLID